MGIWGKSPQDEVKRELEHEMDPTGFWGKLLRSRADKARKAQEAEKREEAENEKKLHSIFGGGDDDEKDS